MATATERATPRWRRWLHRVGYITTVLIVAELIFVGYLFSREWLRDREMRAALVEESRTHETPLLPSSDRFVRGTAIELLKTLPPLRSLDGNGLRFVAMPSFGTDHYAIALWLPPGEQRAKGVLKAVELRSGNLASERTFSMPAASYTTLVQTLDKMADGWPGDSELCLDGSPMAFERVRGHRVTSGIGNCSEHYDRLELLMLNYIRRFAPGTDLPTEDDWHRRET